MRNGRGYPAMGDENEKQGEERASGGVRKGEEEGESQVLRSGPGTATVLSCVASDAAWVTRREPTLNLGSEPALMLTLCEA